jgi:hypothetical protein
MHKFNFASINMRQHNAPMHTLLNSNKTDDILFIQEPWFNCIGVTRSDDHREGRDVLGGAANPSWSLAYPYFTPEQCAKVMTYVHIHNRDHPFKKNFCRTTTCNNIIAHLYILITNILVGQIKWRAINFYNNIDNKSALTTLLSLDLESTIPTIIFGDFNLHSSTWSPADWSTSTASMQLEEWMATQTFSLLTQPGVPTHRGENRARNSTIDLVWCNFAASIQGSFQGAHIDWAGSLGSDHALIRTIASTPIQLTQHREDQTNQFDMSISAEEWKEWEHIFTSSVPPNLTQAIANTETIDALIDAIYTMFNTACTATMKKKGNTPGFSSKWWNNDCREAASALANAHETEHTQLG